jgi:hypothetical protein
MTKTREEVEALKSSWSKDPCWDIEETEGFEDHQEELLAFRNEHESRRQAIWQEKQKKTFEYKAESIIDDLPVITSNLTDKAGVCALLLAEQQVKATVLLAEQVKRVGDLLDQMYSYDQYIRGR